MMYESIKNFSEQFKWKPVLQNADKLGYYDKFIIAGMGGSHLAADLLKLLKPDLNIKVNSDYGLPDWKQTVAAKTLVIANSYSGNTEETIDAYEAAKNAGLEIAVIAAGGELLKRAQENGRPYIELPSDHQTQPRMALGSALLSLLELTRQTDLLQNISGLAGSLYPLNFEELGQGLADRTKGKVPVVYSSYRNRALAYIWKINLNETGKSPAFCNYLPELDHNELAGWDLGPNDSNIKNLFHIIFLGDKKDHPKIQKRLQLTKKIVESKGLSTEVVELGDEPETTKIFTTIIIGAWYAYHLALSNEKEAEQVPLIEELKKQLTI